MYAPTPKAQETTGTWKSRNCMRMSDVPANPLWAFLMMGILMLAQLYEGWLFVTEDDRQPFLFFLLYLGNSPGFYLIFTDG